MDTKQLKELVYDFVKNDVILDKPISMKGYERLSDSRRLSFIRAFLDLLLNTEFICKETKYCLKNRYLTMHGVVAALGMEEKAHTVQTRIWRDIKKINRTFGERMLVEILKYENIDIELYEQRLYTALSNNTMVNALENIDLTFAKGGNGAYVTQEQFDDFICIIKPYIKSHKKYIEDNLDRDTIAYIRRILSSTLLTETDKERKSYLIELLGIDDAVKIIEGSVYGLNK